MENRYMKEEQAIDLLIVDDHALVRQEIRSMLGGYPDIHVEAIFLVDKFRPGIVLMDINMPRMNGIEATAQIMNAHPHTIIIGFSVNATTENHEAMKQAGAVQLVPKDASIEELHHAIREAAMHR
jgi:DNA-binding NarL/FixJ family response regulator